MNLNLALLVDACRSGNSTHRLVATGHGIRSLSVNMSPISRATSHGAQRVGRFRTEKDRTSKTSGRIRSEEHTSELQSLMRISYAVFCLKQNTQRQEQHTYNRETRLTDYKRR